MLSFIYWLSKNYEHTHGSRANVLYINRMHFEHLRQEFSDPDDLNAIRRFLGMNIMISLDALHPHLAEVEHTAASVNRSHETHVQNDAVTPMSLAPK